MKVLNQKFELRSDMYEGFQEGGITDLDVVARACGNEEGQNLLTFMAKIEVNNRLYNLRVDYATRGQQRIAHNNLKEMASAINETVIRVEETLLKAVRNRLSESKHIIVFAKLAREVDYLFIEHCYYDGHITLEKVENSGETHKVLSCYESEIGLAHMFSSIAEIKSGLSDSALNEYVEYVLNKI